MNAFEKEQWMQNVWKGFHSNRTSVKLKSLREITCQSHLEGLAHPRGTLQRRPWLQVSTYPLRLAESLADTVGAQL